MFKVKPLQVAGYPSLWNRGEATTAQGQALQFGHALQPLCGQLAQCAVTAEVKVRDVAETRWQREGRQVAVFQFEVFQVQGVDALAGREHTYRILLPGVENPPHGGLAPGNGRCPSIKVGA
ncbi:hypothetical protein D3C73_1392700 [compost metagenome]